MLCDQSDLCMANISPNMNPPDRYLVPVASSMGFMAVALGAFGAHGLRDRLGPEMLAIWHTGVEYHLAHSLAAILAAILYAQSGQRPMRIAGWLFIAGNVIFSGSLYVLAVSGVRALGAITPLGGLAYLGGWLLLAISSARSGSSA
jgi:uncharacterized membrane protein YgdD (TMEM256/DUF423 family)